MPGGPVFQPSGVVSPGGGACRRRVDEIIEALHRYPRLLTVAAFVLAGAAIAFIASEAGPAEVLERLSALRPAWLLVALAGQVLALAGYTLAYRTVVTIENGPRLPWSMTAATVIAGFGPFLHGGGFELDRRTLARLETDERMPTVRVLGLGALEYAIIAPAACACAIVLLIQGSAVDPGVPWPWALAVPIGFGVGLPLAAPARRRRILRERSGGVWTALERALAGVGLLHRLAARPPYWGAFLGMGVYWGGEVLTLWAGLGAVGASLSPAALVLGLATGYALSRRSMPLGGAGATELLLSLALVWVGLDFAAAVAAVLVYRGFSLLLPTLPALRAHRAI